AIWNNFFRPCGAWTDLFDVDPAMNRWAIFGRPCGTLAHHPSRLNVPVHQGPFHYRVIFRAVRNGKRAYTSTFFPGSGWMILIFGWRDRICCSNQLRDSSSPRSEEHTSEVQSPYDLVCRLLLEKKNHSPPLDMPSPLS